MGHGNEKEKGTDMDMGRTITADEETMSLGFEDIEPMKRLFVINSFFFSGEAKLSRLKFQDLERSCATGSPAAYRFCRHFAHLCQSTTPQENQYPVTHDLQQPETYNPVVISNQ
jgi:hypothetical protein